MSKVRTALWIAAWPLVLAACSRGGSGGSPAQSPAAAASASPAERVPPHPGPRVTAPGPTASPSPSASPSVSPSPSPDASATALPTQTQTPVPPKVPRLAPDAAPEILSVTVSETTVHPGDRVFGSVVTSSNVASVEARIGGYALSLSKVGVGRFTIAYTVAPLPWFMNGSYAMHVLAHNARGDTVERTIPLTVR